MEMYVAVSGGFDPIHIGHLRYLQSSKSLANVYGMKLMVILDSQEYLIKKGNGHPFYPTYEDREELLNSIKYVDKVVKQINCSTAESLEFYKPRIFAKGGDRTLDNLPKEEIDICMKNNITIFTGIGGFDKPRSSSILIRGNNNVGK